MNKVTFSTTQLQAVLNKATKGAGNNKMIPMTSLIAIEVSDGKARFTTTDLTNYLSLSVDADEKANGFYIAVNVDLLSKLVAKMTSETTTLEITDSSLNVVGNGMYQIDLTLDEEGNPIRLTNPIDKFTKGDAIGTVNSSVILNTIASLKSALLTTADYPWYTCYYINGDILLATDTYTIGSYAKGFLSEPLLISSDMMDLIGLLSGDISVYKDDTAVLFDSGDNVVYGKLMPNIEKYSVDELTALVEQDFDYSCKVAKNAMLDLLDRISLFVGAYDNGEITLSFSEDKLEVTSKYANEATQYVEPMDNSGVFECKTDISTLITQFKSQLGDVIEIQYGADNAIKLVDNDLISVVALLGE